LLQNHAKQKFPLDFERNLLHAVSRRRNRKKMKKTNLLAVLALAASSFYLHAQSTVSTPVVGFETKSFPARTTGHGVGFVLAANFQGTATSVSASSLTVSGASFTANQYAPSNGLPSFYIQITSGSQTGLVVDIIGNTSTQLNVGTGDLSSVSGTPSFVVRPHIKVSTLFQGNTALSDYTDTLTLYNSDGSVTSLLRDSTSPTGWLDSATFNSADSVVYPGQGFLLSSQFAGSFTSTGVVNPSQTIVPIYSGLVNLVSLANPSNGKNVQSINLGANLADYVDTVGIFTADGSLSQSASLLWAGTADGGFLDSATFSPANDVNAGGTSAILVNAGSNTAWTQPSPLTP